MIRVVVARPSPRDLRGRERDPRRARRHRRRRHRRRSRARCGRCCTAPTPTSSCSTTCGRASRSAPRHPRSRVVLHVDGAVRARSSRPRSRAPTRSWTRRCSPARAGGRGPRRAARSRRSPRGCSVTPRRRSSGDRPRDPGDAAGGDAGPRDRRDRRPRPARARRPDRGDRVRSARSLRSTARASSTRDDTPTLPKMLRRCVSTVFLDRKRAAAICVFVWRSTTRRAISSSRAVSDSSPLAAAAAVDGAAEPAQLALGLVAAAGRSAGLEGLGGALELGDRAAAVAGRRERAAGEHARLSRRGSAPRAPRSRRRRRAPARPRRRARRRRARPPPRARAACACA